MAGEDGSANGAAGAGVRSPSPELLFSLGTPLAPWLVLLSFSAASRTVSLVSPSTLGGLGVRQLGSCQRIPVKLFNWNGFRCHLRHGAPVRSSARRPALIAPVLALGPSLWPAPPTLGCCSAAPSSLFQNEGLVHMQVDTRGILGGILTASASSSGQASLWALAPNHRG